MYIYFKATFYITREALTMLVFTLYISTYEGTQHCWGQCTVVWDVPVTSCSTLFPNGTFRDPNERMTQTRGFS